MRTKLDFVGNSVVFNPCFHIFTLGQWPVLKLPFTRYSAPPFQQCDGILPGAAVFRRCRAMLR